MGSRIMGSLLAAWGWSSALACAAPRTKEPHSSADPTEVTIAHCEAAIALRDPAIEPIPYLEILGVVALERELFQPHGVRATEHLEEGRRFTKTGLFVRAGETVDLVLPADSPHRIGWATQGGSRPNDRPTRHLRFPACRPADCAHCAPRGAWLVFPGGFYTAEATCLEIRIRSGTSESVARVSLGMPCD